MALASLLLLAAARTALSARYATDGRPHGVPAVVRQYLARDAMPRTPYLARDAMPPGIRAGRYYAAGRQHTKSPALANFSGEHFIHFTVKSRSSHAEDAEWLRLNPKWSVRRWSNEEQEEICQRDLPGYQELKKLLFPVERSDIVKLLALHDYGGVYSDSDVRPMAPIDEWLPYYGYTEPVHLLLGDEFPRPETGNPFQLESWAFAAVPRNPVIKRAIEMLPERVRSLPHTLEYVTRRTGPAMVTSAVINFLKEHGQQLPSRKELNEGGGKLYELSNITGWEGPLRVLILPYRAFGWNVGHGRDVFKGSHWDHLVEHEYDGSWRSSKIPSLAMAQQRAQEAERSSSEPEAGS